MDRQLISIILPIHNQADHIQPIIEEYQTILKKLPTAYEILLVVNGLLAVAAWATCAWILRSLLKLPRSEAIASFGNAAADSSSLQADGTLAKVGK